MFCRIFSYHLAMATIYHLAMATITLLRNTTGAPCGAVHRTTKGLIGLCLATCEPLGGWGYVRGGECEAFPGSLVERATGTPSSHL